MAKRVKTNPKEQKVFEFLNGLRDSGVTNMLGARPFIERQFPEVGDRSSVMLKQWMTNFNEENDYSSIAYDPKYHGPEEGLELLEE